MNLRLGYFISGAVCGVILLISFITSLPDGKLHLVFCDVGQGDATYIRFPDGRDVLIDGGPNGAKLTACLGRHMPFWDRTIDIVILTHPQKDHMDGLLTIFERFRSNYFAYSDVSGVPKGQDLITSAERAGAAAVRLGRGDVIRLAPQTALSVLWPPQVVAANASDTLGTTTETNDRSVVILVTYGTFDALLSGDADSHVDPLLSLSPLPVTGGLDVLKVPHHGSKNAMTSGFLDWIRLSAAPLAVVSVGKNSYGHPAAGTLDMLERAGYSVLRTDIAGDIDVVSDGTAWSVTSAR